MQAETITTNLRVVSEAVKPFQYGEGTGEVVEVKAVGEWGNQEYRWPVSLHITVPPGCGAIPLFGDDLKITIERTTNILAG